MHDATPGDWSASTVSGEPPHHIPSSTFMRFHPYPAYPLWATLPLTAFVAVLVPIYWHE